MELTLNNMMRRDYFRLRRKQRGDVQQAVERSIRLREAREESLKRLDLNIPSSLPIAEHADEIVGLLQDHDVLILAGETGSGKTTQIPKLCMRAGLGVGAMIGHTQPRRVAARTVSQRLAAETKSKFGEEVGYSVRFGDQTSDNTIVRIMTDGLLLSEIPNDRYFDRYDAIIVDEAHERSLNIDFLLGYLKRLMRKRSDFKLIVTSATINVQRFSEFFDSAPVVEIPGRSYPISIEYMEEREDLYSGIIGALDEILKAPFAKARDVLVFLSGEREIFEVAKSLRQHYADLLEILPLYSRLRLAEQEKIFAGKGKARRVILATNVAETSITVPNIGYVIDPGKARINRYSYRSKLQRLPVEPISKASSDQRKGRCGRVAPGVCYRLYSEDDYLGRPQYSDPEVKRVNLASVLLQMKGLRLGEIESFAFIDPPEPSAVKDAYRLLDELEAVDAGRLSKIGRSMSRIPLDPRLSRMVVEASRFGALTETLILVSALSVSDPRERPADKMSLADQMHVSFEDEKSDFLSFLKLWYWVEEQRLLLSKNKWRKILSKHFISFSRVQEWREVHRQLKTICQSELGYKLNREPANYEVIHENILVGCLSLIARHDIKGEYLGARNLRLRVFPGSSVSKPHPNWILASEISETSRVYARNVAKIDPVSIEKKSMHLVKISDSEPTWSKKRGEAIAYRTVTLYGLKIVERRAISYSTVNLELSIELLISEGLVRGILPNLPFFLEHNLMEIDRVREIEAQHRRRGILVEDAHIAAFYDSVLPPEISRFSDLQNWIRKAASQDVHALFLSPKQLFQVENYSVQEDFPGQLDIDGLSINLKYAFAPGTRDDGLTFEIPLGFLQVIGPEPFEWSVPGMLELVVENWIRSLPKNLRKAVM
ncbi:ATP-dependent RNA helicase HrpA, partial [Gammaproteobacteria bacterium]|nr:ATP-dependent RNA helicase HrpA [Gammaproteobacteria bacterium]